MSVFDLRAGQRAVIGKVTATGAAADRLSALGLVAGAEVTALGFSLFKSSVLIGVGQTRVALRKAVATQVEVTV